MRKTSKSKWWVITPNVIQVVFNQCLSLLLSGIQHLECKISELFKGLKQVWTWTCVCSYISCKSFKCFVTLIQYAKFDILIVYNSGSRSAVSIKIVFIVSLFGIRVMYMYRCITTYRQCKAGIIDAHVPLK